MKRPSPCLICRPGDSSLPRPTKQSSLSVLEASTSRRSRRGGSFFGAATTNHDWWPKAVVRARRWARRRSAGWVIPALSLGYIFLAASWAGAEAAPDHPRDLELPPELSPTRPWLAVGKPSQTWFLDLGDDTEPDPVPAAAESLELTCDSLYNVSTITDDASKSRCPSDCGYVAHVDGGNCQFKCVKAAECGKADTKQPILNEEAKVCTACTGLGCSTCGRIQTQHGLVEKCSACIGGYSLSKEGVCESNASWVWSLVFLVVGTLLIAIFGWYFALVWRPVTNQKVLDTALANRELLKFRDHTVDGARLYQWQSLRELCEDGQPIGGPTMLLHFNYQFMVMIWAAVGGFLWLVVALWADWGNWGLLTHGLSVATTPIELCKQKETLNEDYKAHLQGKLTFIGLLYVFTVLFSLGLAIWHQKMFTEMDSKIQRMRDFALCLKGFPAESGADVEENRLDWVTQVCGFDPVGVSVCWDFGGNQAAINTAAAKELDYWLDESRKAGEETSMPTAPSGKSCGSCYGPILSMDNLMMGCKGTSISKETQVAVNNDNPEQTYNDPSEVEALLNDLCSTSHMYVVFNTIEDRQRAATLFARDAKGTRHKYKENYVIVAASGIGYLTSEPDTILWHNFGIPKDRKIVSLIKGIAGIFIVILVWGVCAYGPYGWYIASSYSALGVSPGFMYEFAFSMIVIIGNQLVYISCENASTTVGFRFQGHEQAAYVCLYTAAVLVNLIVDIFIIFLTQRSMMDSLGLRADDGSDLMELSFVNLFMESYYIRAALGYKFFMYNFPSCFILPFMFEAIFTVVLPYDLGKRIVGSRPVSQKNANDCLAPVPMDIGRYVDVALNMIQTTIALFFVSGYVFPTFIGLVLGHLFIWWWDHRRVLRHMMSCDLASDRPDVMAQKLFVVPCGILAGAFAVQFATDSGARYGITACFVHGLLHFLVIHYLIPKLRNADGKQGGDDYAEVASEKPANWFNTNVVHSLRSRYVHKHNPPCIYFQRGKEYLQKANEEIGMYYQGNKFVLANARKSVRTKSRNNDDTSARGSFSCSATNVRHRESNSHSVFSLANMGMRWRENSRRSLGRSSVVSIEMADAKSSDRFSPIRRHNNLPSVKAGWVELHMLEGEDETSPLQKWPQVWLVLYPHRIEWYPDETGQMPLGALKLTGESTCSLENGEVFLTSGRTRIKFRTAMGKAHGDSDGSLGWDMAFAEQLDKLKTEVGCFSSMPDGGIHFSVSGSHQPSDSAGYRRGSLKPASRKVVIAANTGDDDDSDNDDDDDNNEDEQPGAGVGGGGGLGVGPMMSARSSLKPPGGYRGENGVSISPRPSLRFAEAEAEVVNIGST